ncbi:hypothetical protein BKA24_000634 [Microbacterium marinum]|uniref:Uncharacterized protein n=1 Tax=Microbacterium marinum TaxID=421115 RepID=A0A7W7BNJ6_9MICO|nr:hypothetical protein [Microbacterium marinum]
MRRLALAVLAIITTGISIVRPKDVTLAHAGRQGAHSRPEGLPIVLPVLQDSDT